MDFRLDAQTPGLTWGKAARGEAVGSGWHPASALIAQGLLESGRVESAVTHAS